MRTYILRRLLQAIPLLLVISGICFALMHLAPGGPLAHLEGNPNIRAEDIEIQRKLLGLDRPLHEQYGRWLGGIVLRGDFGTSYKTGEPVLQMIRSKIPATIWLMGTAFLVALSVGLAVGIIAALRRAGALDYAATFFAFIGISLPVFWAGLMAQLIFGIRLGWLPISGAPDVDSPSVFDWFRHLVMPVLVLSLLYMASWSRYMRASLIESMTADHVRTARAKGLSTARVVLRHGVRNALIPVVTVIALQVPNLFTGAIITETVFSWPGMGRFFWDGINKGDYPRLMAILLISSSLIVVFNLIADFLYAALDPRIRYE
ncbi:MAG: ABC transporter permease [Acidobacteriota bacterium]